MASNSNARALNEGGEDARPTLPDMDLNGPVLVLADADREAWLTFKPKGLVARLVLDETHEARKRSIADALAHGLALALRSVLDPVQVANPNATLDELTAPLAAIAAAGERPIIVLSGLRARASHGALGPQDSIEVSELIVLARSGRFGLVLSEDDMGLNAHRIAEPMTALVRAEHANDAAPDSQKAPQLSRAKYIDTSQHREAHVGLARHARALADARGPLALSALERLFVEHYLPLCESERQAPLPHAIGATVVAFRRTFEEVYGEVAKTLPLRQKRPRMLCDLLPATAALARRHGARAVECVLVDGMRFDLGLAFERQFSKVLGPSAELVERALHWAALPSNTGRQLSLLAHGIDALRTDEFPDTEPPALRERPAATLRRVRVGNREILKLDLVEAALERLEPSAYDPDELGGQIADAIGSAVQKHTIVKSERTLLCVFGDHGFALASGSVKQGGATPEEVFVPSFAWVIDPTN